MKRTPALPIAGFLVLVLAGSAARAADYEIKAREAGAGLPARTAQCTRTQTLCFLDLPMKDQSTLHIAARIENGAAFVRFMKGKHPLATNPVGTRILEIPIPPGPAAEEKTVKLYPPHTLLEGDRQDSLRTSPVLRLSDHVTAEIEIGVWRK